MPGTVLLMQNVDLGHTQVIQICQKETLSHQGAIIHENCCSAAQMIEFSEEGRRWSIKFVGNPKNPNNFQFRFVKSSKERKCRAGKMIVARSAKLL
jgi:hypothetical protein